MPQMAPLSWLTLFIIFSMTLMAFCIMNYFIYTPSKSLFYNKINIKPLSLNWKW